MSTKTEQYKSAFEIAESSAADKRDAIQFEMALREKANELQMSAGDFLQFSNDARNFLQRFIQLRDQDAAAAAAAAKAAAPAKPTA